LTEILFYHLQQQGLDQVLPSLLEKSLERGWKALVVAGPERLEALDEHLWTYADDAFLPHGRIADGSPESQPVLLAEEATPINGAHVCFLAEPAALPLGQNFARIVMLFDGRDEDALASARLEWARAKQAGVTATYWQQDESRRWQKKA